MNKGNTSFVLYFLRILHVQIFLRMDFIIFSIRYTALNFGSFFIKMTAFDHASNFVSQHSARVALLQLMKITFGQNRRTIELYSSCTDSKCVKFNFTLYRNTYSNARGLLKMQIFPLTYPLIQDFSSIVTLSYI